MKIILIITLLLSAATFSFAGEQGNGNKSCENCTTSVIDSGLSGYTDNETNVDEKLLTDELNNENRDPSGNVFLFIWEDMILKYWT